MYQDVRRLGLWSVVGLTVTGYLYAAAYIAFFILFPMREWSGIADFASYFTGPYAAMFTFIQFCAFSQSMLTFIFSAVVYRTAPEGKKAAALTGFGAAVIFFAYSCFHYVIQWTSVRTGLVSGNLTGLEMFVMSNFDSPLSVLNVTGWTLLLGISNLAFSACFAGMGARKAIRIGFFVNGVSCLLTFVLYTLGVKLAMLGWTAVLAVTWYVYPMLISHYRSTKPAGGPA